MSRGAPAWINLENEKMRAEIRSMLAAAGLAIAGYSIVAGAAPRVQTGPNAEVTHDGLTRVDKSVMDVAYVKADLDLRPYKKLWLVGADIQYRVVDDKGKHYRPGRDDQTEFPISDEGKAMLKEVVTEAFREELAKSKRYQLTDHAAPDTLLLIGTLIDVVSKAPPDDAPGRYEVYLSSVGEATLALSYATPSATKYWRASPTAEPRSRRDSRRRPTPSRFGAKFGSWHEAGRHCSENGWTRSLASARCRRRSSLQRKRAISRYVRSRSDAGEIDLGAGAAKLARAHLSCPIPAISSSSKSSIADSGSGSDGKSGEARSSGVPSSRVCKNCSTIATISPTRRATFRSSSATGSAATFAARCLLTQFATYSRICAAAR